MHVGIFKLNIAECSRFTPQTNNNAFSSQFSVSKWSLKLSVFKEIAVELEPGLEKDYNTHGDFGAVARMSYSGTQQVKRVSLFVSSENSED